MNLLSRECSPTVPEINIENHGENHRENRTLGELSKLCSRQFGIVKRRHSMKTTNGGVHPKKGET